jgi:Mannosyl-glycoprotein endo-beta-N-acetylglucosaminidase
MHKSAIFVFLLFIAALAHASPAIPTEKDATTYIQRFSKLAVQEMQRSGIPASVKLAQAMLESGAGKGKLATMGNNHFGIKCKDDWTGSTFYTQDDDYENGRLINSCFRKYDTPEESYRDHTNFLMRNKSRYKKLFDLNLSDYKGWAEGLKMYGYATDEAYSIKLIDIIEKHNLMQFDAETADNLPQPSVTTKDWTKSVKKMPSLAAVEPLVKPSFDAKNRPEPVRIPDNYQRNQYNGTAAAEENTYSNTMNKFRTPRYATQNTLVMNRKSGETNDVANATEPNKSNTGSILRSEYTFSNRLAMMDRKIPKLNF